MVVLDQIEPQTVAGKASLVLSAWKNGERLHLGECRRHDLDALETERMEVLESVVESLQGHRNLSPDRIRAAERLLEHLAKRPAEISQD